MPGRARPALALVGVGVATAMVAGVGPQAATGQPPPSEHDPDAVRQLADEVLQRREFRPPARSVLDRIFDWIGDNLLPGDSNGGGGSGSAGSTSTGGGSSIFTVVLLVLAVAGIAYAVMVLWRGPRFRRRREEDDIAIDVELHRSATEWASAAERHEAVGDWKEGLRCRFRALVERLTDRGVVPEIPGRTSGELRVDVRASAPDAAAPFGEAAELFERAWYGDLPTGPDEARHFAERADRVLTSADADAGGRS